ncbi:1837_t:CDS:1, partial [Cetraspora pellucida]
VTKKLAFDLHGQAATQTHTSSSRSECLSINKADKPSYFLMKTKLTFTPIELSLQQI